MGKAVQGSSLYHACPADIQRTSVACAVNLSVSMSSIMHRQQQEQQEQRQNNPKKLRVTDYPDGGGTATAKVEVPSWASIIQLGLDLSWYIKQAVHGDPWEPHGGIATLGPKCQAASHCKVFLFPFKNKNFDFLYFSFLQIQKDRQTNPRADFESQPRHKWNYFWCYIDIASPAPNDSREIKKKLQKVEWRKMWGIYPCHSSVMPKIDLMLDLGRCPNTSHR